MTPEPSDLRAALEARLQFDAVLADLAARFVHIPASEVDAEIEAVQRGLCELLGFDRSSIWELADGDAGTMVLMHVVQPPDLPIAPSRMDARTYLPFLLSEMLLGRAVVVPRLEALPDAAAVDRETLRQLGTKATAVFPLRAGVQVFGALAFAMTRGEREWPEPVVKRLGLVAEVLAGALGRKRAEMALRESHDRMSLAAAAAGAGLWELDLATGRFWATEKAWELLGLPPETELIYERLMDLVHPADRDRVEAALQAARASGKGGHVECRVVRPDGSVRWLSSRGHVRLAESGEPRWIMGAAVDATARKQAEAALQEVSGRLITAQEKERARLAKELHDGLSQNLALLAVELDLLGQQPPETMDQLRVRMGELSGRARALSGEVHRLSHGLHPAKLERLGLVAALGGFCREIEAGETLTILFQSQNVPRDLPEDIVLCLYRVAQEALWNVVRHSGATGATVELAWSADDIRLSIRDDGRGFDSESSASHQGLGLLSMRERVAMVQGQIEVQSGTGRGTTVRVRVPLPERTGS